MSKFALRYIHHTRVSKSLSLPTHNQYFLQIHPYHPFSFPSQKSLDNFSKRSSFTVDYLINSCGLTPEKAVSASKHVKFETSRKPDLVLSFFKNQGFTKSQISYLVNYLPPVLLSNPEKTLLPKLEFFKSKGASASDIAIILSKSPAILKRSLEKQLIPSFEYYSNLLRSEKKTISAIKRSGGVLLFDLETYVVPNIELLKAAGVPIKNLDYLLKYNPATIMTSCSKFKEIVEEVKKLGFDPSKVTFLLAIHALRSVNKSTWDRKIELFKKWGWSDGDAVVAFRKNPWCMAVSEDKINLLMDYWVNKMGWEPSLIVNRPVFIMLSVEKRIIPRCEVYKALLSKKIIKPGDISLGVLLESPEKCFLEKFINRYDKEAPKLLKLYKEKRDLSK